jgi:hypothetical protein
MPRKFIFRKGTQAGPATGEIMNECLMNPLSDPRLRERFCNNCTLHKGARRTIKVLLETSNGYIVERKNGKATRNLLEVEILPYNKIIYTSDFKFTNGFNIQSLATLLKSKVLFHNGANEKVEHGGSAIYFRQVVLEEHVSRPKCRNHTCWLSDYCKVHLRQYANLDIQQSEILLMKGIEGQGLFVSYPTPGEYKNKLMFYGLSRYLREHLSDGHQLEDIKVTEWLQHGDFYANMAVARSINDKFPNFLNIKKLSFSNALRASDIDGRRNNAVPMQKKISSGPKLPFGTRTDIAVFVSGETIADYGGIIRNREDVDKDYDYEAENQTVQTTAPFTIEIADNKTELLDGACHRKAATFANSFGPNLQKNTNGGFTDPRLLHMFSKEQKWDDDKLIMRGEARSIMHNEEILVSYFKNYWLGADVSFGTWSQDYVYKK